MEQFHASPMLPVVVDGAYPKHTLLAIDTTSKKARSATTTDTTNVIGHLTEPSYADGDRRTVRAINAQGTQVGISADAVTVGTAVLQFVDGELGTGGAGTARGISLEDSGAGEYFEYLAG